MAMPKKHDDLKIYNSYISSKRLKLCTNNHACTLRDTSVFLIVSASIEELIVYFIRVLSCTFTLSAIL